ncbi:hypothetical protein A2U01_0110214, partial [Trifolium medium]|nr:hypothetical protein [Trifolium medium]
LGKTRIRALSLSEKCLAKRARKNQAAGLARENSKSLCLCSLILAKAR